MKIVVGLLFLASFAFAQGTDADLTGNILDSSGARVPDARVTALNIDTGVATKEMSNSAGVYLFPVLPPGPYRVTAEKPGFKKFVLDSLVLRTGDHVRAEPDSGSRHCRRRRCRWKPTLNPSIT